LRHFLTTLAALLLGCGAAFAQMAPPIVGAPAMGATSPLGVLGATSSVGPVGIPMGATELAPGGLSPGPLDPTASTDPCFSAGVSSTTTGSTSTFDGSGMNPGTTQGLASFGLSSGPMGLSGSCGPGTSAGTASGTASTSILGGATTGALPGGGIPLGATELNNAGVSPMFTPSIVASPCGIGSSTTTMSLTPGSTMTNGMTGTSGSIASPFGC
jgi:hypothetical protein